jgi:hypothetical protein
MIPNQFMNYGKRESGLTTIILSLRLRRWSGYILGFAEDMDEHKVTFRTIN